MKVQEDCIADEEEKQDVTGFGDRNRDTVTDTSVTGSNYHESPELEHRAMEHCYVETVMTLNRKPIVQGDDVDFLCLQVRYCNNT